MEPLRLGPGTCAEIAEQRGKVKGTCPLAGHPRSEFPVHLGLTGHPIRIGGQEFWIAFLEKTNKREFGVRVIRLGIESKAGAAVLAAWTPGEESRDARWCPAGPRCRLLPAVPWGLTLALQLLGRPCHCRSNPRRTATKTGSYFWGSMELACSV